MNASGSESVGSAFRPPPGSLSNPRRSLAAGAFDVRVVRVESPPAPQRLQQQLLVASRDRVIQLPLTGRLGQQLGDAALQVGIEMTETLRLASERVLCVEVGVLIDLHERLECHAQSTAVVDNAVVMRRNPPWAGIQVQVLVEVVTGPGTPERDDQWLAAFLIHADRLAPAAARTDWHEPESAITFIHNGSAPSMGTRGVSRRRMPHYDAKDAPQPASIHEESRHRRSRAGLRSRARGAGAPADHRWPSRADHAARPIRWPSDAAAEHAARYRARRAAVHRSVGLDSDHLRTATEQFYIRTAHPPSLPPVRKLAHRLRRTRRR